MKTAKKLLCLFLAILSMCTFFACGNEDDGELSDYEKITWAVEMKAAREYFGRSIGGNDLVKSSARITHREKLSDTEYRISGVVTMSDAYGTSWTNSFDCIVTYEDDHWDAGTFEYTSTTWRKS